MTEADGSEPVYCSTRIEIRSASLLESAGWERRTVTDAARVAELEGLYNDLGFETLTRELDPATFGEACTTCAVTACSTYLALFTRKREAERIGAAEPAPAGADGPSADER